MQSATAEKLDYELEDDEAVSREESGNPESVVTPNETEEHEKNCVKTIEVDAKDSMSLYVMPSQNYQFKDANQPLVPTMVSDILRHLGVYILILIAVGLAMFKVYQVQQTRNMTATLNEIIADNDNLQKEWLALLAQRQDLSAHSKIKAQAKAELKMIQPKTAQEILITLD